MLIRRNISLERFNTFGLDYKADTVIHISTEKEAVAIFSGIFPCKRPILILGDGSNLLFTGNFRGTILRPEMRRIKILRRDDNYVIVSAGSGIIWDEFVRWCVENGFSGLENLSGIPGRVGAVPVQNIGAYGAEVMDYIFKVRTISSEDGTLRIFKNEDCGFGYRTSIFKKKYKGKYLVTRVYFKLKLRPHHNLGYGSLKSEIEKSGKATIKNIRKAVLNIRNSKLPDPAITGNAGSFFKNPVLKLNDAVNLKDKYPDMPCYDDPSGGIKIAAGWLIEQCGWKGKRTGDAGVHEKQALVIVNNGNATGREIFDLAEKIRKSVKKKFGINLEREVEVIG